MYRSGRRHSTSGLRLAGSAWERGAAVVALQLLHKEVLLRNNIKTTVLLAGLAGLILFAGSLFGTGGLVIALFLALAMVGGSYWFSDRMAIASAKAKEVPEGALPEYWSTMRDLTQRAGIPMPRLYVSPDPQPNAFATGRNPEHAAVCVTQGLLEQLDWSEIRGVLAHELAHVKNRDILIGSVAAAIATFITFPAHMAMFASLFGGNRDSDRNPIGDLLFIFLAPIAAGAPADGAQPQPGVPGRPERRPAARRRRAPGAGAREARPGVEGDPVHRLAAAGPGIHRQSPGVAADVASRASSPPTRRWRSASAGCGTAAGPAPEAARPAPRVATAVRRTCRPAVPGVAMPHVAW